MAKKIAKCPACGNMVEVKSFSIIKFLVLCAFLGVPGFIYLLVCVFGSKKCPICKARF